MSLPETIQSALAIVKSQELFIQKLLVDTLGWPISNNIESLDDIAYSWSAEELKAEELDHRIVDGKIYQIQPLDKNQPWGIFLLEFSHPDVFIKGRGFTGLLRKVLRGLVPNRIKSSNIPSWKSENILFICSHNWEHYRFAHFRSTEDKKQPRLATFGWGPNTSNRTACEFNLPELVWPEDTSDSVLWVKKWTQAFDKEELTKQFYKTFAELYEEITAEIASSPAHRNNAMEQAQLLLDRMLFLSFLQKKQWLNNDLNYLYTMFSSGHISNLDEHSYYGEVLFPLFQALSSRHYRPKHIGIVPFLNGGLFNLEIGADQTTSLTKLRLKIKNRTFKKLFDSLLNKYNFTVMEDTPLNREIAVDPEMIGKVFETVVLVSDTGGGTHKIDLRKQTGSFYTPRIVVHFICKEVMLKYLSAKMGGESWESRIKKLLAIDATDGVSKEELNEIRSLITPKDASELRQSVEKLKCCDPAVGSGAFAVGLLQELLNLVLICEACERGKDPRIEKGTNYLYEKKIQIIENSIYGVDIQAKAVDICKLRLWLSLVVDYELGVDPAKCAEEKFAEAVNSIPPLPNLAYKIIQGDALLDQIHGAPFRLERVTFTPEMKGHLENIKKHYQKFFREEDPVKKRYLRKKALELRIKLSRLQLEAERSTNLTLVQATLFGESARQREAARWREEEEIKITKAIKALDKLERDFAPLLSKSSLSQEDENRLACFEKGEGTELSFSWRLDFPEVFNRIEKAKATIDGKLVLTGGSGQQELVEDTVVHDGFDIIVGNPPFVTSKDKIKRELYRERWAPYCFKKYHLLVPFYPRAFEIMSAHGQLGYIVSDAFKTREFGQPLIEQFFPKVNLNKLVDCSGLYFPGHGTPTCITFANNLKTITNSMVRVAGILPGGGDLRTPPEDSPLWQTIESNHDNAGFSDSRISVFNIKREIMFKWPWNFDNASASTKHLIENASSKRLFDYVDSIGQAFFTNADEVFLMDCDFVRRIRFNIKFMVPCIIGDEIRDWASNATQFVFKPYNSKWEPIPLEDMPKEANYLKLFRTPLGNRASFAGPSYDEVGKLWYGYHIINESKLLVSKLSPYAFMATHNHFCVHENIILYKQTAPIITWRKDYEDDADLFVAILNSSSALFWLKQVCYNKGAGSTEEKDRFEYAGGKVELLPISSLIALEIETKNVILSDRLRQLANKATLKGLSLKPLSVKALFYMKNEAYYKWNSDILKFDSFQPSLLSPFDHFNNLDSNFKHLISEISKVMNDMIALQEEMDWLVYESYELIAESGKCTSKAEELPEPLQLGQRPFELWIQAEGNFAHACDLIPADWNKERKELWTNRLKAIRDNEHIRRIEKPVYKRRWYQPDSYEKQLEKAYEWWLLEKAEWWLENKRNGGPLTIEQWAHDLWEDSRIRAASEFVKGAKSVSAFEKVLKKAVNETTVPENIPFAKPWDELERSGIKIPTKVKNIRGKLNVPRERFNLRGRDEYIWAGLIWKDMDSTSKDCGTNKATRR